MKSVDYLIIGGSAAGTTAAEVIRGLKPDASITIVTEESHEEYSRVLIPHYIRHKVQRDQVFLKKSEWYTEKKIKLLKEVRAQRLEASSKSVKLSNGEEIQYGKLLITVGGYPIKLDAPGSDLGNVFYMRTVDDADNIVKVASSASAKASADRQSAKGVIVGGGFIGLEFASGFKKNGVEDITILVREPYFWSFKLDEDSSKVLVTVLEKNGIKVVCNEEVERFEKGAVVTKSGKNLSADIVGVGIGIKSDFSFLSGSGVDINRAIVTNEYLETNVPDVYAAGDCAEFKDVIFERQHIVGNWANATSQGSAVGKNMALTSPSASDGQAGVKTVFETASSYSINFFDVGSCTFIGVTEADFSEKTVLRGSVDSGKMTRIFIKKIDGVERIVGATVINNPREVAPLTSVVKNRTDVSKFVEKLSDSEFDLKDLSS